MASNVEPEEARALMSLVGSKEREPATVADRDFRRPRRLSAQDVEDLARRIQERMTRMEAGLGGALGCACPLELASIGEASAEDLFAEAEGNVVALRFDADGQPAWIVWEDRAAVSAVERILGSRGGLTGPRRLSGAECRVLERLLTELARETAAALGLSAGAFRVGQSSEALGSWRDGGEAADVHRLEVEISVDGPGGPSTLRAYVPALAVSSSAAEPAYGPQELPDHLTGIPVELSVRLVGCQVSLDELLRLEEGDVIPIEAHVGEPALLAVEGRCLARGRLGTRNGQLALRIESMVDPEEELR